PLLVVARNAAATGGVHPDRERGGLKGLIRGNEVLRDAADPAAGFAVDVTRLDAARGLIENEGVAVLYFGESELPPVRLFVAVGLPPVLPPKILGKALRAGDVNRRLRLDVEQLFVAEVERVLLAIARR